MPLALRCFPMVRLLAKIVAVIAIYSIALQALLLGYLHAAHVGFDSVAVICTAGDFPNEDNGPLLPHGRACDDPCSLACNGISIAVVPPDGKFCILLSGRPIPMC